MSDCKKYYWLKLKDDFFNLKEIKKLRKLAGGDTFTIIYLKMQLLSIKNDGKLFFECIEETFYEEIALALDEDADNVKFTLMFLENCRLLEQISNDEYLLPKTVECIGSESSGAERVRRHRDDAKLIIDEVRRLGTIPYIENYQNNKLYDGNYYTALKRDGMKCVSCKSDINLNMHHIIGNRNEIKESRNKSSLITLCRKCHSKEHAQPHSIVTDDILQKIDFDFDFYNCISDISNNTGTKKLELGVTCNSDVTTCNTEKRREEKRKEIREEKNINEQSSESFFEEIWSLYPKKKGKGKISKSKKTEIYKLGDAIINAIEQYRQEIAKEKIPNKFIMHGSTFFNSGYVDYIQTGGMDDGRVKKDNGQNTENDGALLSYQKRWPETIRKKECVPEVSGVELDF